MITTCKEIVTKMTKIEVDVHCTVKLDKIIIVLHMNWTESDAGRWWKCELFSMSLSWMLLCCRLWSHWVSPSVCSLLGLPRSSVDSYVHCRHCSVSLHTSVIVTRQPTHHSHLYDALFTILITDNFIQYYLVHCIKFFLWGTCTANFASLIHLQEERTVDLLTFPTVLWWSYCAVRWLAV